MFGDNKSVVDSAMKPQSKLHKRHTALSFHRVRESIAAGFVVFTHINSELNLADILSKHWGHAQVWHLLKPLLFHEGDTVECQAAGERYVKKKKEDGIVSLSSQASGSDRI